MSSYGAGRTIAVIGSGLGIVVETEPVSFWTRTVGRVVFGLDRHHVDIDALRANFLDRAGQLVHDDATARDGEFDGASGLLAGFHRAVEETAARLDARGDAILDNFFEPAFYSHGKTLYE